MTNPHSLARRLQCPPSNVGREQDSHLFTWTSLNKAQVVIDAMANYDLQMLFPKNIPTLCTMATSNFTWPDNILGSSSLKEHVLVQDHPEEHPPRMDPIPIIITLKMSPGRQEILKPNFNWPTGPSSKKSCQKSSTILTLHIRFKTKLSSIADSTHWHQQSQTQ